MQPRRSTRVVPPIVRPPNEPRSRCSRSTCPHRCRADELDAIVTDVFAAHGFETKADMGKAMKAVNAEVAGRADGRTVADLVKSRLA